VAREGAGARVSESPPYLALVVEHYRRPRNQRSLASPTHSYEGANPLCGDRLRMELQVRDGALVDAAFQASACAIATASASLLTERVRGAMVSEVTRLSDDEVVAALGAGVPAARRGCATLPLRVLRRALDGGA
jgi:nitrogen fixation NifU-like protein